MLDLTVKSKGEFGESVRCCIGGAAVSWKQAGYWFFILYYDQQMPNYFTNYHTPTCFDTIMCHPQGNCNQYLAKLH